MNYPTTVSEASLLRRALQANAVFSTMSGFLVIVFDQRISALVGSASYRLWPVGVMLLVFGAYLAWFSNRETMNGASVISIIASDLAWVAGTVILLAGWHDQISVAGILLLGVIGLFVFLLAEMQWIGLRRLRSSVG